MKTVKQIVDEYKNRQVKPKYENTYILLLDGENRLYQNVCNLVSFVENGRYYVEFDYTKMGRKIHAKRAGKVIGFEQSIDE